jgi:hypothetical protein
MSAIDKTKSLIRMDLPITQLVGQKDNPNEMTDREFNMLTDNIERTGITDPILVRKIGENEYRVVGGHHRLAVAKLYDFETVPCTVIDDPDFDDDAEKFQVVRMNVIHGRMSPDKFVKMYQSLSVKYTNEVAAEMFGFVEEEQFLKMTKQMKSSLPKELQGDFEKAAKEIKTIDGLSKLLNGMFSKYGNSLPYGFMLVDFGGRDSIWLRMESETRKALLVVGKRCIDSGRSMDSIVGGLIRLAAAGKLDSHIVQLIAQSEPVVIPDGFEGVPSLEVLSHVADAVE